VRPGVCLITAASRARLYQRLPLNDDGTVMKVSDQALVEFAVLSLSGIVWSGGRYLLADHGVSPVSRVR